MPNTAVIEALPTRDKEFRMQNFIREVKHKSKYKPALLGTLHNKDV